MFEIELNPDAGPPRIISEPGVIRLVLRPDFPFEQAMEMCRQQISEDAVSQFTHLFGSRECHRDFETIGQALVIRSGLAEGTSTVV